MNWEELKQDSEAITGKSCKNLGVCELEFGCINGKPYITICPITSRVKSEEGPSGVILELDDTDESCFPSHKKEAIIKLVDNALNINNAEDTRKVLEKLLQEARNKSHAIKSLEI